MIREKELALISKAAYAMQVNLSLLMLSLPTLLPIVIFSVYSALGNSLNASIVFSTISLLSLLQMPLAFMPMGARGGVLCAVGCDVRCDSHRLDAHPILTIHALPHTIGLVMYVQFKISLNRIRALLLAPELEPVPLIADAATAEGMWLKCREYALLVGVRL